MPQRSDEDRSIARRRTRQDRPAEISERDQETRQRLIAAARRMVTKDGFDGARIVDVATDAGVGVGTFYRHFDSKAAVFEAAIDQVVDEIYQSGSTDSIVGDDPLAKIEAANQNFFDLYRPSARIMANFNHLATRDETFRKLYIRTRKRAASRVERSIKRLQAEGRADATIDAAMTASALISMMNNIAFVSYSIGVPMKRDVADRTMAHIWAAALGLRPAPDTGPKSSA